ncbi:hypothetical protein ERJ75_001508600 [Trypanosoma vivax]|nr:hypothetical protein ERJ75_001508600 [Trypanosoma vivax]
MAGQTVGLAQLRRVRHGTGKPKQPRKTSFDEEKKKEDGAMARQRIAADMFKDAEKWANVQEGAEPGSNGKALGSGETTGKEEGGVERRGRKRKQRGWWRVEVRAHAGTWTRGKRDNTRTL